MRFTRDKIQELVTASDYSKGMNLYLQGKVSALTTDIHEDEDRILCDASVVDGGYRLKVRFITEGDHVTSWCSCYGKRMDEDVYMCRHVAATMIAFIEQSSSNTLSISGSDEFAQSVMNSYLNQTGQQENAGTVKLIPKIDSFLKGHYPTLVLSIGIDRMYLIKNLRDFAQNVIQHNTFSYGKMLTLQHSMEVFDPRSRQLADLVLEQFVQFRTLNPSHSDYEQDRVISDDAGKGILTLKGDAFDRFFDIFLGETLDFRSNSSKKVTLTVQDPEVSVSINPSTSRRTVRLTVKSKDAGIFFGSRKTLYCAVGSSLMRCSETFRLKVYPFLTKDDNTMYIATADMPAFSNLVLQQLREVIPLDDPQNLLEHYLPDEFTEVFYFDLEENKDEESILTLRVAYRYGDKEVNAGTQPRRTPDIKRNLVGEQETAQFVSQFMSPTSRDYILEGEENICDFLSTDMELFQKRGDVMITDRLRKHQIIPSRPALGISVSEGMLMLNIDTGEFPPEELEDLYDSLLLKKRYYKLKDGRILNLDGSPLETVAELSHMLRLDPKDLAKGQAKVPAFRALYLDSVLAGNDSFQLTRDRQFRSMIRSFKSVAESDYSVNDKLDAVMRPYQKIGFQWMKTLESCNFGGILADEMGLGKTLEAIAYLSTVDRSQTGHPSLIVCPASLILNWMDEFARFDPDLKVRAIMGTAAERAKLEASSDDYDVWVTSYELLRQDIKTFETLTFYCCILDEGQHVKNQSTQASKAVKQINCTQRFILTGTPIENRLSELWNLFDFLMPGYLYTHGTFVNKLEKPAVRSKDPEAMAQLRRLVQPFMLRRLKKDVLKELPPIIEHVHRVPLSQDARKVYMAMVQQSVKSLAVGGDQNATKMKILAALTRLRQICCDPKLCFENYEGSEDKLDACMELCSGMVENGHQILLFSQFTTMLDRIRERLNEENISSFTLQGSTTKEMRAKLVKEFNAGGASVFLISLKAGGTGLNLTAADVVIHYDPWWNIAAQDQATGRAHRIGQQSSVQVYKLIAENTIEEKIMEMQELKAGLMDALSDGSEQSILSMSQEDLLALLN